MDFDKQEKNSPTEFEKNNTKILRRKVLRPMSTRRMSKKKTDPIFTESVLFNIYKIIILIKITPHN